MGPLEADKPWSVQGVEGAHRFIERIWRLYNDDVKPDGENKQSTEKPSNNKKKKSETEENS